jgi:hypothetical protein
MRRQSILFVLTLGLLLAAGLMTACNTADPLQPVPVASVQANIVVGENGSLEIQADPEELLIDANDPNTPTDPNNGDKAYGESTLTAEVLDPDQVPLEGVEVVFSATAGELASGGSPVLTDADGHATDTLRVFEDDPDEIEATASWDELEVSITIEKEFIPLNNPPVADAGEPQEAECGTVVTLDGSGSTDADSTEGTNDDIVLFEWFEDFGTGSEVKLGEGETLDVEFEVGEHAVTLQVTDSAGATDSDDTQVTVVDTIPPEISVHLSPEEIWPPNHHWVDIVATVIVTDCSPVSVYLVSVESSEPVNDVGDGNTEPDITGAHIGTEDYEFRVRAERSGTGMGRTYTVVYRAVDESGNEATATAYITVPHDQGN